MKIEREEPMSDMKLKRLAGYSEFAGPVVAVIMDGVGIGPQDESDGVYMAYTPVLDTLLKEPLCIRLKAHGIAVGMPLDDDMGNSEVGHNALGAGRVLSQGAKLVGEAIISGKIFQGRAWRPVDSSRSRGAWPGHRSGSWPSRWLSPAFPGPRT